MTEMTMREIMAKALWDAGNTFSIFVSWEELREGDPLREMQFILADAAIKSLRTPTEAMQRAGWFEADQRDEMAVWNAMVESAIEGN